MAEKVRVWFDPDRDFLKIPFCDGPGFMRRTVRAAADGMSYLLARNTQASDDYPSAKLRTGVEQFTTLTLPAVEGPHR